MTMNVEIDSARLARMLDEAQTELQRAADGSPLCKVSMTGTTGQSVKYFEGRWAALREVQRGADPHAAFETWRRDYLRHEHRDSGDAWRHYAAGGVDALFELLN